MRIPFPATPLFGDARPIGFEFPLRHAAILAIATATLLSVAMLTLTSPALLNSIGRRLNNEDALAPADLIVVISGDRGERIVEGVQLFRAGMGKDLLISGAPIFMQVTASDLMRDYAVRMGVPPGRIRTVEDSSSTFEDALKTLRVARELGAARVTVVTSPYHIHRAKLLFRSIYPTDIQVRFHAVQESWFRPETWWRSARGIHVVAAEYVKLLAYKLGMGYDAFAD